MMASGIYEILNTADGKRYVGSAVDLGGRRRSHTSKLQRGCHHNIWLQRAWNKYGEAAFQFKPLLVCAPENLLLYEQLSMAALRPEYNICKVAGSQLGMTHTPEAKAKVGAASRLRRHSTETRAKMSAAGRGRTQSAEHIEKRVAAHRSAVRSPEMRARISATKRGVKRPPEVHARILSAQRGLKRSPESRARMARAQQLRRQEEHHG